jgi:hypothetical protein
MTPLFGSVHNRGSGSITASSAKASAAADACNYRDAEHSDSAGYDHLGAVVTKFSVAMSDGSPFSASVGFDTRFPTTILLSIRWPGCRPNMTTVIPHIILVSIP